MCRQFVETLEQRKLFAGLTLLTHGWNGNITEWIATAAADITAQLGGPSQVPEYILTLTPAISDGHLIPTITQVPGTATPQTNTTGQIILVVDWTSVSTNINYTTAYVGGVVANYLMTATVSGITLADLPIHEISQSRGCSLLDEINYSLGRSGVWVEQETYLDPRQIPENFDPAITVYDNVEFCDDYWRTDGNSADDATNGQPVDGAYNLNTYWIDGDDAGYTSAHDAVTGYYVGTIDQNGTEGGDGPIITDWYGDTPDMPARDQTGFYYSSIMGGSRPLSGVWAASGGTGDRTQTGHSGPQWCNVSDLAVTTGDSVVSGHSIQLSYIHQDRGGPDTITFYLDTDQNPFNGSFAGTLGSTNLVEADATTNGSAAFSTKGIAPGTYYVCAEIEDYEGNVRYDYSDALVINAAPPATSGFNAAYYAAGFNGPEQLARVDDAIDFNYATDPVDSGTLTSDNLAANWVGHVIAPATGTFTFYTMARGRAIIWINGEKIYDHTGGGAVEVKSLGAKLNAGQRYLIRVKYFGPSAPDEAALIQVAWASDTVRKQTLRGGAFDGPDDDSATVPLVP
jgi:hypothetical protein